MLAQLLGKKSTPAKRAGGVGAGAGATGFSRRKEPVGFSGATDEEGGGSLERPVELLLFQC